MLGLVHRRNELNNRPDDGKHRENPAVDAQGVLLVVVHADILRAVTTFLRYLALPRVCPGGHKTVAGAHARRAALETEIQPLQLQVAGVSRGFGAVGHATAMFCLVSSILDQQVIGV